MDTPQRLRPALARRARLTAVVLLAMLAVRCAWEGGGWSSYQFQVYNDGAGRLFVPGLLLLIAAWACMLVSWRLALPLLDAYTQGCAAYVSLLLALPLVWALALLHAVR